MQMKHSLTVDCSRERLWSFLEETEKKKLWMKGLLSIETTNHITDAVGSTFRMGIKEGWKVAYYDGLVTACEKPSRLEVVVSGGGLPKGARVRADYRLTEFEGATRLDYVATFEGKRPGILIRVMMPLMLIFARMQLRGFLNTLKALAEAPPAAAA